MKTASVQAVQLHPGELASSAHLIAYAYAHV